MKTNGRIKKDMWIEVTPMEITTKQGNARFPTPSGSRSRRRIKLHNQGQGSFTQGQARAHPYSTLNIPGFRNHTDLPKAYYYLHNKKQNTKSTCSAEKTLSDVTQALRHNVSHKVCMSGKLMGDNSPAFITR
jgi:hypothetical protein